MSSNDGKLKVVVVGGGPAGAATAMSLVKQGHSVDLFEAYPHPSKIRKNSPKAYSISLGKRGQDGLQSATGITPESVQGGIMTSNLGRHPSNKIMQRAQANLVIPRQNLTSHILNSAEQAGVKIHYEHRLVEIDFDNRVATVEDKANNKQHIKAPYDLLVGADGSKSQVRRLMERLDDFEVVRSEVDTMEYQVAALPSTPFTEAPKDTVHAWNNKKYNAISLAFPQVTGGLLFAIVFPEGNLDEFRANHKKTGKGYDDAMNSLFPDLDETAKKDLVDQLLVGTPANGGLCVWTSALGSVSKGVVLVGDSGHGMWPSLGQGANCALESTAIFCKTCQDLSSAELSPADLANAIVKEFDSRRHTDAIAAVDLTYGGIGARKSRGRYNAPLSYKLQIMSIMMLNKLTLGIVPQPALLRLMKGENLSYETARKYNFYYEKAICLSALVAVSAPVIAWYRQRK